MLWAIFLASPSVADEGSQAIAFRTAAACGACHSRVYDEWSESWMARSYSNATFQAIYNYRTESDKQNATTTARDCLRCHSPLGFLYQDATGDRAETKEGVSCDFCHRVAEVNERSTHLHVAELSTSGAIYGPTGGVDSPAHSTQQGTVFADSSLCALCHLDRSSDGIPLENTFEEWKNSEFARRGIGCADCHMPQKEGAATDVAGLTEKRPTHASHRFHGGHANSPMLISAARVEVISADASRELQISVRNSTVGHNFPSNGAHLAELALEVEIIGPQEKVLRRMVRSYRSMWSNSFGSLNSRGREMASDKPVTSARDTTLGPLEVRIENFPAELLRGGVSGTVQLVYRKIPEQVGLQQMKLAESFFTENYQPVVIDSASFQIANANRSIRSADRPELQTGSSSYSRVKEAKEAYENGDYTTARELFQAEADKGDLEAKHYLANLYYQGHGVSKDIAKALVLLDEAAGDDYVLSIATLGAMYLDGDKVSQDYEKAFAYFLRAAELGHLQSIVKVSQFYLNGAGVEQSNSKAAYWFKEAAVQGHLQAQHAYALLFAQGKGVPLDYVQAYAWINMPAEAGDDEAIKNRARLINLMGPEDTQKAIQLAEKFKTKFSVVE
ncbi:MAG: multiheme c-type cytochrome [Gammaproteobacteria bacterium]